MKILLLTNKSPWPPKDGGSAATLAMIDSLDYCGANLKVLSLNTVKHFTDPATIPPRYSDSKRLELVYHNTKPAPLKVAGNLLFSDKPYITERFESLTFRKAIVASGPENFDIIQFEGLAITRYLPLLRKITNARLIFRPHNIEHIIWKGLAENEKNPLKRKYFRLLASRLMVLESEAANNSDALVAITRNDLEWFLGSGLRKPAIVSHPFFRKADIIKVPEECNDVFFIGSLDWQPNIKGITWFTENIWPLVIRVRPDARLHIAGRNPGKGLRKKFNGHNIKFYGEVEDSAEFMKDKLIMIAPLFEGSGLRMKIIEAMSHGRVVVSTSRAAEGIGCTDGMDIFIRDTPEKFASCITFLLNNRQEHELIAANALRNVSENYDILAEGEKLMNFFSGLT